MDAVELARQSAAALHAQAFAGGLDPWSPYEFAVAEARRREFDVEATAPGAALLGGGRATLLPDERLILHESIGTPFERAFLVAHEIGHAELGDGEEGQPTGEIDPARSAEPSPVGADRVVDYGRRQRREVQMDLFAREFLLPRPVVRRLHLVDGLTASDIARRIGAPFEVVAQQLLDALLLPPVTARTETARDAPRGNPLQDAAARHRGAAYLLEAGPGTGKTRTLIARVEGLLDDGVDPRRILLLTFSNKAASEMAERIARTREGAAAAMWIGTFHAFGLDVIRRFHADLGLPRDPRMMDRTEAVELLEREFPRLGLARYRDVYDPTQVVADILAAISRAKDEVVDPAAYAELGAAMVRRAGTEAEREAGERACEVARAYEAYEAAKGRASRIDFGDLVHLPVRLLEGDAAVRAHLRGRYDHVLVDEYQDVNRGSVRLLVALCGDGANLWAVGDARQSIYRFRGASSFSMARFGAQDFPGGVRGRLERNYRSTEEVVGAFSSFAAGMAAGIADGGLEADRGAAGRPPALRTVDLSGQQTVALAEAIGELRAQGHAYRDQAVLCTGNEKLSRLGHDLERLGVPVLFLGSLFERPEVRALLAFLSVLTDRRAMGLVGIASGPDFPMAMGDVAAVLDHLREGDGDGAPAAWLGDPGAVPGLTSEGRVAAAGLARALDGFDRTAQPWTLLATLLLDRTRMAARVAEASGVAERARGVAIWQLLNFVRAQPPGGGLAITRLLDRVRRLSRLGDDRDLRQLPAAAQGIDAVRLMTIHAAKGLEFPVVHLPDLNADTLPRTPPAPPCPPPDGMVEGGEGDALAVFRRGQAEEQECLFYVALSRARDRLLLYAPTQKSNGQRRALSPFLERLGAGLTRRHGAPARALPPSVDDAIELAIDGALTFSESQIELYERCPRRFFYTHILRVGGRRTPTPYTQMHEAVRSVVRGIVGGDGPIGDPEEPAALETRVGAALAGQGLEAHGYADDYRALALGMVRYFLSSRRGQRAEAPEEMVLAFGEERIVVRPDEVLVRPDGGRALRRIRTGHRRSSEEKEVGVAAFVLASRHAAPGAAVELVHLADQTARPVVLSERELQTRRERVAGYLAEIRRGRFPAEPSSRACPGCPAYFICGPVPAGPFRKKI